MYQMQIIKKEKKCPRAPLTPHQTAHTPYLSPFVTIKETHVSTLPYPSGKIVKSVGYHGMRKYLGGGGRGRNMSYVSSTKTLPLYLSRHHDTIHPQTLP